MGKLDDKVAIITGASRGIGRSIALEFAKEGASVVVNFNRSEKEAKEVAKQIERIGQEALLVKADVSKPEEVKALVEQTVKHFKRVDILVNNVGWYPRNNIEDITLEEWEKAIHLNLRTTFLCSKYVAPYMKKKKSGCIVNFSSVIGHKGSYHAVHYSAAKAGILGFTKALAKELAPSNIRVNSISPGPIDTDLLGPERERQIKHAKTTLFNRIGKPEEIAKAAVFLVSNDSSFVTGADILVDGGWVLK